MLNNFVKFGAAQQTNMVCKEELKITCCNKDTLIQTINTHIDRKSQHKVTEYRLLKHQRPLRQLLVNFQLRTSKLEVDTFCSSSADNLSL